MIPLVYNHSFIHAHSMWKRDGLKMHCFSPSIITRMARSSLPETTAACIRMLSVCAAVSKSGMLSELNILKGNREIYMHVYGK